MISNYNKNGMQPIVAKRPTDECAFVHVCVRVSECVCVLDADELGIRDDKRK